MDDATTIADVTETVSELTVESFRPAKAVKASARRPVCLVMVVRNEAGSIERCLRSAAPFVDTYSICDIGSTDGTKEIIREVMTSAGIEGVIRSHPWGNCGHNKTLSLLATRKHCPKGWSWVVEPDEVLVSDGDVGALVNAFWECLPSYVASVKIGGQHRIFSNDKGWYYKGKALAQPQLDCESVSEDFPNVVSIIPLYETGAPPASGSLREIVAAAVLDECSFFQLAKECQSQGLGDKAQALYKQCADAQKSELHEKYMACVELVNYSSDADEKYRWTWKAIELDPSRLDAPYYALSHAVNSKRVDAFTLQLVGMGMCLKNRALLPEHKLAWHAIYDWKFSDVYSIVLFWKGFYQQSAEEALRALTKCPECERGRIEMNLKFATDALKR